HGETHGCPWLVSTNTVSTAARGYTYIGPSAKQTRCPTEPVGPYDISWNDTYGLHNKMLTLQSTGGVITQTLSNFLMSDGRVCDGIRMDDRGGYCRFMSYMI
ncbi:DUF2544 domain-containing protein, partial [Escherichia coli]|nr:DUF2544 domain-containing protein [Escherichia coli]